MSTETITCTCKVCNGRRAEVPTASVEGARSKRTVIHNLVCIAHSPLRGDFVPLPAVA